MKKKKTSNDNLNGDRTLEINFNLKSKNLLLTNCLEKKPVIKTSLLLIAAFFMLFIKLLLKFVLFRLISFPLDWLGM